MDFEHYAMLTIMGTIFLVFWIAASAIQRRRQKAFRNIAEEMRFQFVGTSKSRLLLSQSEIAKEGEIENLMKSVRDDIEIEFFEHLVGGGKSATLTAVAVFASSKLNLPSFELYPKGIFRRAAAALGAQDSNLNAHTRFSDRFVIRGEKHLIEAVFSQQIVDCLTARPKVSLEGSAQTLVYFRDGKWVRPKGVKSFINEGLDLTRLFIKQANRSK